MLQITCACGYVAKGEDPDRVEAETWHHALKAHEDMLKGMSVDQLQQVLAGNHSTLGLAKK